jgi:hypothetical protein
MSTLNKVSTLIESQLPEFIRSEFPTFVEFLQKYYEFLEQPGNPTYEIKLFQQNHDVDLTRESLLSYFRTKVLPSFPEESQLSTERIIKSARDFYAKKGTPDSFKFLFHVLYDKDLEIFFPKLQILRASDGKWVLPQAFRLTISPGNQSVDLNALKNRKGIGTISRATCIIERVYRSYDAGTNTEIYEAYVSGVTRPFVNGETLDIEYVDTNGNKFVFTETIIGSLSNVRINPRKRGRRYVTGDPVVIYGGLDPGLTSRQKAVAYVNNVTSASIDSTTIVRRGYGFRIAPNSYVDIITKNTSSGVYDGTGNGSGGNIVVSVIDTTSPNANIQLNWGLDAILLSANLTLNVAYDLPNTNPDTTFLVTPAGTTQTTVNIANAPTVSSTNDYYNSTILRILSGTASNGFGANINTVVISDYYGSNTMAILNANTPIEGTVNISGVEVVGNTTYPNLTNFIGGTPGFYNYLYSGKTIEINGEERVIDVVTNANHLTVTSAFSGSATNKKLNANSILTTTPDVTSLIQINSIGDTKLYNSLAFETFNVNPILTTAIISGGADFDSEPPASLNVVATYETDYSSDGFITINPGSFSTYNPVNASIKLSGSGFSTTDDWYNGRRLLLESQYRTIIDYDGASKTAFLDRQFETNINQINILTKTIRMDNRPIILGMGILANVEVINGGTGYAINDVLNFTGTGVGAAGRVSAVSGGFITAIELTNRGEGYPIAPNVTVNGSGTGAILKAYLLGDGEDITPTATTLGEIIDFKLTSRGAGYISTPNVSLKIYDLYLDPSSNTTNVAEILENDVVYQGTPSVKTFTGIVDGQWGSNNFLRVYNYSGTPAIGELVVTRANITGNLVNVHNTGINVTATVFNGVSYPKTYGNAKAKANAEFLQGLIRYNGYYLNSDGFISSDKRLQDKERYHNFSYELVSEESFDTYKKTILDVAHPAGTRLLPTHVIPEDYNLEFESDISAHEVVLTTNNLIDNCSVAFESNNVISGDGTFDTVANVNDIIVINSANTFRAFSKIITGISNNYSLNIESPCILVGEGKAKINSGNAVVQIAGNTNPIARFISTGDRIMISVDGNLLTKTINSISGNAITLNSNTGITNTTNLTIDTSNPRNYGNPNVPAIVYYVVPSFSNVAYEIVRTT